MPDPVSGNIQLINIIAGDKLRPGDLISARVQEILPDGRYKLLWNGKTLTAQSLVTLKPGQIIRARVEGKPGNLLLHLMGSKSETTVNNKLQISPRTLLTAALLRSGSPLPEEAETARRAALLSRTKGLRTRMARLYAELLSKGSDPTADFLESVDSVLSGDRDQEKGGGRQKQRGWPQAPDHEELKNDLLDEVEDSDPIINLLNSLPGDRERWLFSSIIRNLGEDDVHLTWKIRNGINPALALTVRDGERTFEFLMEGLNDTRMSVFVDDEMKIDSKLWKSFCKNLALMKIKVDDTILSIDESDGFTAGTGKTVRDLEGR